MSTLAPSPHARQLAGRAEAERFLHALYRGGLYAGEWLELRCLDCRTTPSRPGPRSYHRSITDLVNAAMQARDDWDVFFGVGIRRCPATHDLAHCPHAERGADHVSRFPGCWADLDVQSTDEPDKPYETLLDALQALYDLAEVPTIIVGSGTGLHAYWTLTNGPQPGGDDFPVGQLNRAIRAQVHGDNVVDAARILRLPGTYNHKHGRPLPVTLLTCEAGR